MPESKTKKEVQILEVARELFWKHGIRRVSVEEICRKAEVSKMTFYRYYPNKKELAKATILLILDESMAGFQELMASDISFSQKMEEMIRLKFESISEISEELVNDIYFKADPEIKALYEAEAGKIMQEVMGYFVEAQQQGQIRADVNPAFMMYMLEKMRDLYFDENLRKMIPNMAELAVELNMFYFYGIGVKD